MICFKLLYLLSDETCTEDTFEIIQDTNANGATRDFTSDTVEECKTKCLEDSNCVGFDFNTVENPNQCWIHTNADNIAQGHRNTGATGVNLYIRIPCGK